MTNEWWLQIYEYSLRIFIISQDIILTLGMELSNKSAMGGWKYKCTQWKRRRGAHRWGNDGEITDCNCAARANDDWACLCVCFFFFSSSLFFLAFLFFILLIYISLVRFWPMRSSSEGGRCHTFSFGLQTRERESWWNEKINKNI